MDVVILVLLIMPRIHFIINHNHAIHNLFISARIGVRIKDNSFSTRVRGITYSASARRREGDVFDALLLKDVKSCTTAAMLDSPHLYMSRGMPWPQTSTTHYYTQLGLSDKCRAIKGFDVYNLEPLDLLNGLALGRNQFKRQITKSLLNWKNIN